MADYYPAHWDTWSAAEQAAYVAGMEAAAVVNEAAAEATCEDEDQDPLIWVENGSLYFGDIEVDAVKLADLINGADGAKFVAWTNMRP